MGVLSVGVFLVVSFRFSLLYAVLYGLVLVAVVCGFSSILTSGVWEGLDLGFCMGSLPGSSSHFVCILVFRQLIGVGVL